MSKTTLNCRHNTASLFFILSGSLFILVGCAAFYKTIGLTPEQTADQTAKDQASRGELVDHVRTTTSEIVSYAIAAAGSILSGLLAKWLSTERKMTTVLIKGVEAGDTNATKKAIHTKAVAAGIEPKLAARVRALT